MSVNDVLLYEIAMRPNRPTKTEVLESCSMLNALDPEMRSRLVAASFLAYAERGELIWSAGAPADFAGVVGAGFVKMTKESTSGHEIAVELLGPGQDFGLLAVLDGANYALNAIAVSNTWYLKLPTSLIQGLFAIEGAMIVQLIRQVAPRLRCAQEMMIRLSSSRVEERIAVVLLMLADSYGEQTGLGTKIGVPLTRQDIAEMAGTSVETTVRILSSWQRNRVVHTDCRHITILNGGSLLRAIHTGR